MVVSQVVQAQLIVRLTDARLVITLPAPHWREQEGLLIVLRAIALSAVTYLKALDQVGLTLAP